MIGADCVLLSLQAAPEWFSALILAACRIKRIFCRLGLVVWPEIVPIGHG